MPDKLSPKARALLARPVFADLATLSADGTPQVTPVWIDIEGDKLVVNTARGRVKANNAERRPHVAVSVLDPDDPYTGGLVVRGRVTEITPDGADEHIDGLAKKYLNQDTYPLRQPGEVRVKLRITPDRIVTQPN